MVIIAELGEHTQWCWSAAMVTVAPIGEWAWKVRHLVNHVNPLKDRDVKWLHLAVQVEPTFLISDIRALWRSALSARVPECL